MPRRAFLVGLTGGIASGKSEVLRRFKREGAKTISLDSIVRELSRKGAPAYRAIVRTFGRWVLDGQGEIDRKALAEQVFARPRDRRRLEAATHPLILREMRRRLKGRLKPVTVVDVPLLFEAGVDPEFDATICVSASPRTQLRRLMRREGLTRTQAKRRLRAQWPIRVKERLADVTVLNERSLTDLSRTVRAYARAFDLIAKAHPTTRS